jgi:DNA invertase Pin-like site-specific DNA recombinase
MSIERLRKALGKPHMDQSLTDRELLELILIRLDSLEKGNASANQKEYAKASGVHRTTVYRRKASLRQIGALKGEGKLARYDMSVTPGGAKKF